MAGRVAPYIDNTGLVFAYDQSNTVRSYVGEPTTNLAYAVNSYLNSNSNWWINAGNTVFNDNDTSIPKPVIPNVDTTNLRVFSSTVTQTGGNQQLGSSIITVSPSTTYSFSIYFYFTGTTLQIPPYVRTLVNNDLLAYFAYNGSTNYLTWPRSQWILLKATVTTQANENGIYMSSYTGDTLGEKLAYFGYQVEQKSHCTPLVLGTRSATQGLKDLTGRSTINLSNVSFDSSAQMTFDGTDDYVGLAGFTQPSNPNIFSVEAVVKLFDHNAGTNIGSVIVNNYSSLNGWIFFLNGPNSKLSLRHHNGSATSYNVEYSSGINLNQWYHIAATDDGAVVRIYLNGTQIVTGTSATSTNYSGQPLIGQFGGGNAMTYGNIPVVKIYNRTLTASEIQQNFNAVRGRYGI